MEADCDCGEDFEGTLSPKDVEDVTEFEVKVQLGGDGGGTAKKE